MRLTRDLRSVSPAPAKHATICALGIALCLGVCSSAKAQSTVSYTEFARVSKNGAALFVLEYGIKSPYDGYVRWKFTNNSNKTVYDVSINDKVYTLNDGQTVDRSGEQIASKIEPMDSKTSQPDAVNSSENTGTYSDKNSNGIKRLTVSRPTVELKTDKDGEKVGWDNFGTLEIK